MSVTRTFTVTVVSTGSGNKYFIDGVQQPTLELVEGGTFKFDLSDNTVNGHPLLFSETSGGTHSGGTTYETGVVYKLDGVTKTKSEYVNTSNFNSATTREISITVASSAPTLYYYCNYHSGMGGQANTPNTDFWGAGNWSANLWGISEAFTSGWGADAWGTGGSWGQANDESVPLTGLSASIGLGTIISGAQQGWGRGEWGEEPWGESNNPVVNLSGLEATSSVGSPTTTEEVNAGWGSDGWGVENWGSSGIKVELIGVQANTGIGEDVSWGKQTWGSNVTGWGGEYFLVPEDVVGLSGLGTTSSVGSPTVKSDFETTLSGLGATSAIGSVNIDFSIEVDLTGLSTTSSVGAISPADVMGLTGIGLSSNIGSVTTSESPVVDLTGVSMTSSVGAITPADVMGLTGLAATSSVGSISPADVMGLTGVSATVSVGNVAPLGYESITGDQSAGYSSVTATQSANYTAVNADN